MKKYVKPELFVENLVINTSVASGQCTSCPQGTDCVNATIGRGTYDKNGIPTWCNYGLTAIGC